MLFVKRNILCFSAILTVCSLCCLSIDLFCYFTVSLQLGCDTCGSSLMKIPNHPNPQSPEPLDPKV